MPSFRDLLRHLFVAPLAAVFVSGAAVTLLLDCNRRVRWGHFTQLASADISGAVSRHQNRETGGLPIVTSSFRPGVAAAR